MPLSALKAGYPEADFRLVLAKYRREPLPGDRLDWWAAQLVAAALAPHRKKGSRPPDPKKLIPDWYGGDRPRKRQTAAGVMEMLRAFTVAAGGKVKDGAGSRDAGDHPDRERGADDARA